MDAKLNGHENIEPAIRRYISVTHYLQDYFKYRRQIFSNFTYAKWAAELGFKSRTYLRFLCEGKRALTPDFIDSFSEKVNFSKADREHLILLSLYDQAKNPEYKSIYLPQILSSLIHDEEAFDAAKVFRSISLIFDESEIVEVDKEVDVFSTLLKNKYHKPHVQSAHLFQLNLQLHPVVKKT